MRAPVIQFALSHLEKLSQIFRYLGGLHVLTRVFLFPETAVVSVLNRTNPEIEGQLGLINKKQLDHASNIFSPREGAFRPFLKILRDFQTMFAREALQLRVHEFERAFSALPLFSCAIPSAVRHVSASREHKVRMLRS